MTGWNENNADMSLVNRRRPFDTDLMASHITHETTTTSATSRTMLQPAARRVEDCRLAADIISGPSGYVPELLQALNAWQRLAVTVAARFA